MLEDLNPVQTTVILANGDFPTHPKALQALRDADRIVCCDGAADGLLAFGREPDFIIGDLDSISDDARERFADRLIQVAEQDTNDLSKAFYFCQFKNWENILILGATGKREDHTLGNIALLADFGQQAFVRMMTDTGEFIYIDSTQAIPSFPGQAVSFFQAAQGTHFKTEGLRYPLDGIEFPKGWQATLNAAEGESFTVTVEKGAALVFLAF